MKRYYLLSFAIIILLGSWIAGVIQASTTPLPLTATSLSTNDLLPTLAPTMTDLPIVSTAKAKGECIESFTSFAYGVPSSASAIYPPLPPWRIEAPLPSQTSAIVAFSELNLAQVLITRVVAGQPEIWVGGPSIAIYRPATASWEMLSRNIDGTNLYIGNTLFVGRDGTIWARTEWDMFQGTLGQGAAPVLSKFNEKTRHFELAPGVLEIPQAATVNEYHWPQIVLDQQGIFWIFAQQDGLYRYDPASQTTKKQVDLPGVEVADAMLAPDGSIYFGKTPTEFRLTDNTFFQFFPAIGKVVAIKTPVKDWPVTSGLLVDHLGQLWLGADGYRDPQGTWHFIDPEPNIFFNAADSGYISEMWYPPTLTFESSDGILWYRKFEDSDGAVDGMAWYDPKVGDGCRFTNQFVGNIVEDFQHQLWIVAGGRLYKRPSIQ